MADLDCAFFLANFLTVRQGLNQEILPLWPNRSDGPKLPLTASLTRLYQDMHRSCG